ncbi:hypothetical protein R3P38DRAFT_3027817 [Favolaschia claudopus]|uniref:Uncharacterized protein n=1 Tax=Favolaschia claudopus TaxID=2862362 RepID=A0AAW0AFY2_9AGAR
MLAIHRHCSCSATSCRLLQAVAEQCGPHRLSTSLSRQIGATATVAFTFGITVPYVPPAFISFPYNSPLLPVLLVPPAYFFPTLFAHTSLFRLPLLRFPCHSFSRLLLLNYDLVLHTIPCAAAVLCHKCVRTRPKVTLFSFSTGYFVSSLSVEC